MLNDIQSDKISMLVNEKNTLLLDFGVSEPQLHTMRLLSRTYPGGILPWDKNHAVYFSFCFFAFWK